MAYNELIKNFERIREYMRQFYVYGFKSRNEYNAKSTRSYDDERRRIESWLSDYMSFRQTSNGKNIFISIDSRTLHYNPLYKAWKSKSFTEIDITLHFILFDILYSDEIALSVSEIMNLIDTEYMSHFQNAKLIDESTVRKKLKEYENVGLVTSKKQGKTVLYSRNFVKTLDCYDLLDFYSEAAPCGVIGSYLLDRCDTHKNYFRFKHHYITQALDSDILCILFSAMREKRKIIIENLGRNSNNLSKIEVVPLRIFISVQNGRQYLAAYHGNSRRIKSFRIDYIRKITMLDTVDGFDKLRAKLNHMEEHMWGISTQGKGGRTEKIEFTLHYDNTEKYIVKRLEREKRCGTVEILSDNSCKFSAEVYDTNELIPWIRTFICRIVDINFSNKDIEKQFKADIEAMYDMYGLNGGTK